MPTLRPGSSPNDAFLYRLARVNALRALRCWHEGTARLSKAGFLCRSLRGESEYSLAINTDLSVSCNCADYRGNGRLGSLEPQGLLEILSGPVATRFRQTLAEGRLPISQCATCCERRTVPRARALAELARPASAPAGLMVENTVRCPLACLSCPRRRILETRAGHLDLGLEGLRKVLAQVAALGVRRLHYFDLGEPFASPTILDELQLLRSRCPEVFVHVSTNAQVLDRPKALEAALLVDDLTVSLPGCDQLSLQRYQRGASFERAYTNLARLVSRRDAQGLVRPRIEWKDVLFRWNDSREQVRRTLALAEAAGVDVLSFWPTLSPPYALSWRYRLGTFRTVGQPSWKGRELILRALPGEPPTRPDPTTRSRPSDRGGKRRGR